MTTLKKITICNPKPTANQQVYDDGPMDVYYTTGDAEYVEDYSPGEYHPVQVNDVIRGRYRIVHKLGFGNYSTVWLARDQQKGQFVAIKFIVASESGPESWETMILQHLNLSEGSHPGRKFVATLLDDFVIEGPNGRHHCLVTEVAGPSLATVRDKGGEIPVSIARKAVSQATQGLTFLLVDTIL